jgi:hypothetical protein
MGRRPLDLGFRPLQARLKFRIEQAEGTFNAGRPRRRDLWRFTLRDAIRPVREHLSLFANSLEEAAHGGPGGAAARPDIPCF